MQSISPVTISDFQEKVKVISNKLEIFINPDWIDLCSLAGENYMISANYSSGQKKMSYRPIAATFTATIDDTNGDFNPENEDGLYKTYLKVGRLIRFWTGFEVSGTPRLWQWFEGVVSEVTIDRASTQISIRGSDFTQYLIDVELKSPGNYWGASVTKSTVLDQVLYSMPAACNGIYIAYLDGTQIYYNIDWLYDPSANKFAFFPSKVAGNGSNNLVIHYYTDQVPENMVADILVYVGLYVDRAAALSAMDYTATGASDIIERARFNSGVSCLYAVQKICERCDFEFFFNYDSTPVFKPIS